ncbi:MAG: iron-sulfur cluster-binding domain-containing protein, partial [Candidatus Hydrogenedentes bacterium]|nr:iron-sulfur cluster-binding domain-containing protein [Candidatus Hydrogenedentota bacterium]
ASSPTQRDYLEITVKREEKGLVSRHLHDAFKAGDMLEVSVPAGALTFTGKESDGIVLIAAGVGITPIMSVARYLTDRCWEGEIYVLFVCRTVEDIIFRDEFERLAQKYPTLKLNITLTRADDQWTGPTGRLSKESISEFVPNIAGRRIHICGPNVMMDATKELLIGLGVPKDQIKTEAFGPAKKAAPKAAPEGAAAESASQTAGAANVTFRASDKAAPLPADQSVLDVADELGIDIENSCREGSCGMCKITLLEGEVSMDCEDALEPEEKSDGVILACQAMSKGNIVVDA